MCSITLCGKLFFYPMSSFSRVENYALAHISLTFIYKCLYNYSRYANGGLLK